MSNTSTSPEGKPEPSSLVIVAPKALVTSVSELLTAQAKAGEKFDSTVAFLQTEAKKHGYDRKQAGQLLASAYKGAFEKQGLKGDDLDKALAAKAPDRSKMLVLAFPKSEEAAEQERLGKAEGLGLNARMELARGNTTVEKIKAERAENKSTPKGARPQDGSTPANTTPTPKAQNAADAAKGLTPVERFQNQLAALYAYGKEANLSAERQLELATEFYADKAASEASK